MRARQARGRCDGHGLGLACKIETRSAAAKSAIEIHHQRHPAHLRLRSLKAAVTVLREFLSGTITVKAEALVQPNGLPAAESRREEILCASPPVGGKLRVVPHQP